MIRLQGARVVPGGSGRVEPGPRDPGAAGLRPILDVESLHISRGECVCMVGANGSGKSTLLQVLAGLRPLDAGTVAFDDPQGSASVSIVFQSPDDQIVGSTVERDLAFGPECRAISPGEIRERVDELAREFGLAEQSRRPPHLLSEGEKQRLAFASAWIVSPGLLLLDEPTSRLDPGARRDLLSRLEQIRASGRCTIVHVTHRSEEFMESDRILGLLEGRIAFDGPPDAFLASPAAGRFQPIWSPLHRFRRRLREAGLPLGAPPSGRWNDVNSLLADLVTR